MVHRRLKLLGLSFSRRMDNQFLRKLLETHEHELIAEINPLGYYGVECTFPGCGFNRAGAIDLKLVERAKIVRLNDHFVCPFICWLGTNGPLQCAAYGSYCQLELGTTLPLWETPCLRNGRIILDYSDAESCPFYIEKTLSSAYGTLGRAFHRSKGFPRPGSKLLKDFLKWAETERHGWSAEPLKKCRGY